MDINQNNLSSENQLDLKVLINKFLKYWKYFLLILIVSFSIAYYFNKYSPNIYEIESTLLISDKSNSMGGAEFISGFDLFNGKSILQNEIGILKSWSLIGKAVKELDLTVSYFLEGSFKDEIFYKNNPIVVTPDKNHRQIFFNRFEVKVLDNNHFNLNIKFENGISFYDDNKNDIISLKNYEFNQDFEFGQKIETEFFSFYIDVNTIVKYSPEYYLNNKFYFILSDFESITSAFRGGLKVDQFEKKSTILRLALDGVSVNKEIDFLNKLMSVYIQRDFDKQNEKAVKTIEFIDRQLFKITDSLKIVENNLQEFRKNNKIIDVSKSASTIVEQLNKLEIEKGFLQLKNKYYNYLLESLSDKDSQQEIIVPSIMNIEDEFLNRLIIDLNNLYQQKNEIKFNSTSENPKLKLLEYRILDQKNNLIINVNNIIKNSEISLNDVNERINSIEQKLNKFPSTEQKLIRIERKFKLNDELYTYLLEKRAEASIAAASNISDHEIIDFARQVSGSPKSPKKVINYLISLLFTFIFYLLIIYGIDFIEDKIYSKSELQELTKIPIIGTVGHSEDDSNLVFKDNPKSPISEAFRAIRTNLFYMSKGNEKNVYLITSSVSGEGKTFTTVNIAIAMAMAYKKTIIIGVDLRKPKLYDDFNMENSYGLSNYLIGELNKDQIIRHTGIENLDIILAGPIPPNPAELIETNRMQKLIEDLKENYDNIIIDSPPLTLVTDALLLSKHADSIVYVVRQNYTKKEVIELVNNLYVNNQISNIGIVINDIKKSAGFNVGYGYGYGYGYEVEVKPKKWYKNIF